MKLKLYISILLSAFISFLAVADDPISISGKVTDASNHQSLPGAVVNIPDLRISVATDENGFFSLKGISKKGKYIIQVSFVGYKTVIKTIDLSGSVKVNFDLQPSSIEMEAVIVTGVSRTTEIKRDPTPLVAVGKTYLERQASTNIIDAVAHLPGVNAVTTGPNVSKPFIRGLGFNRIVTLADGIRQEGQQWGDEHGIEVDENAVDKVEVIKGPASLIYGSDAIGGVVNLLPPAPVARGEIKGLVSGNFQSNNGLYAGSARLQGNQNGFVWMGIVSAKGATNYQDKNDGRVYGTAFKETDARVMAGVSKPWGYSYFNATLFNDQQEIPDGSRDSVSRKFTKQITEADTYRPIVPDNELNSYQIIPLHQLVQNYKLYNNTSIALGNGTLLFNLGYQYSHRQEFNHPILSSIPGLNLQLSTYTYDFKYNFDLGHDFQVTTGVNGMYQNNAIDNSTDFLIPAFNLLDIGPFVFLKKEIDKLTLTAGIRYDTRHFKNDGLYTAPDPSTGFDKPVTGSQTTGLTPVFTDYKHTFSGVSGSVGASYVMSDKFTLKADIARGFRAPNISEISDNGVHSGTNIYQIGNSNFNPEFSLQEDLGLFFSTQYVAASAEVFNNNISNYIFNQKLLNAKGEDSIIVAGNQTFKFQQTNAQLYGGEFGIDIHPLNWLHFSNSLTLTYGNNRGNGGTVADSLKYLPLIPPLHTYSEVKAEFIKKCSFLKDIYLKAGFDHYNKQDKYFAAYGTEIATAGYNLLSAGIGANIVNTLGKELFSLSIEGSNLTDEAYQSHLNRLKYFEQYPNYPRPGIFNMGRNVSFKIVVPLSFKKAS